MTLALHSGDFTCKANYRSKEEHYVASLDVKMRTSYLPPPHINRTLARHVRQGDAFSLTCSVTVDINTVVEISWSTPNQKAIVDNRVFTPPSTAKNLSLAEAHLKVVEQVQSKSFISVGRNISALMGDISKKIRPLYEVKLFTTNQFFLVGFCQNAFRKKDTTIAILEIFEQKTLKLQLFI